LLLLLLHDMNANARFAPFSDSSDSGDSDNSELDKLIPNK
jgi:hypothetical protein